MNFIKKKANEVAKNKVKSFIIQSIQDKGLDPKELITPAVEASLDKTMDVILEEHGLTKLTTMAAKLALK